MVVTYPLILIKIFFLQILSRISLKCFSILVPASLETVQWHRVLGSLTQTRHTQLEGRRETSAPCHRTTSHPHLRRPCASPDENPRLGNQLETLPGLDRLDIQAADQGSHPLMSPQILVTEKCGILLKGVHPLPQESG